MSVSSVNAVQATAYSQNKNVTTSAQTEKSAETAAEKESAVPKQDTYESSSGKPSYAIDTETISKLKAELKSEAATFQKMVAALVQKQGNVANGPHDALLQIDKATQLSAQEAISEDGYWGVTQTATRILDFAKALSGGDPSKIGMLRDAFLKGFAQAEKAWGGALPDISQQTRDRVLEGFQEWEDSFKQAQEPEE